MSQNDYWNDKLLTASLDGVEFPVQTRRLQTGRMFARYRYPYRNGQGVEDTGRKIYVFHLTIPLYQGTAYGLYPATFDKLKAINDDDKSKAEVEYVDPEFGPVKVKIEDFDWNADAERRNGGVLTLVLEEVSFDQSLTANLTGSARGLALKSAQKVDYLLDGLGYDLETAAPGSKFPSLTEMWQNFQTLLDEGAMAVDGIAAQIDEVTFVAQHVLNFSAKDEIERWSIVNAVTDFLGAVHDVGDDSSGKTPGESLVSVVLPADMSMYEIAQWRYQDTVRADEIAFNNPIANPLAYPKGTKIKVFVA